MMSAPPSKRELGLRGVDDAGQHQGHRAAASDNCISPQASTFSLNERQRIAPGVGFGLRRGHRRDPRMIGRLPAGGVGRGRVSGERQRLAAAAAPVDRAPLAGAAGLAHPFRSAKSPEGRIIAPDLGKRAVAHVPEFEARDRLGRVARQRLAGRRDVDRDPSPAARAGFWIARVIVGHDHVDDERPLEPLARLLDQRDRLHRLLFRRHQRGAVQERPAIVLRMGDFEPASAERRSKDR